VAILVLVMPVIWLIGAHIKHAYDRFEWQLEATEQVQLFLTQLREDVAKAVSMRSFTSTSLQIVEYDGKEVDLYFNPLPNARHIVRLINGRGGEVACTYVSNVTFQLNANKLLHIALDVSASGSTFHIEDSFRSYID
jgi:hypothetical protein